MRICLFTATALPKIGGQELVVDNLARQFLAMGHEPVVLVPNPRSPLTPDDKSLPYQVVRHWRLLSKRFFVSWYRRVLLKLHREKPFDIIHCHNLYPPAYLAALAQPECAAPLVITSHGGDLYENNTLERKPWVRKRMVQALAAADALVSISPFTTSGYLRLLPSPRRLVAIPNGIDLAPFERPAPRPADLDASIVPKGYAVFLGRLNRRKGVDVLLDAYAKRAELPSLVIIGDGDESGALKEQAARLGLQRRVHFVGRRGGLDKAYLLQNARMGIIPSRGWEAFPLVVLEMQAAGLPIVATRLPGLKDLIDEGGTGLLVPSENPDTLGQSLAHLWASPAQCERMGQKALRLAADFAWEKVARRHLDLFADLLRRRQQQSA
jgi:glycosyltransferase involved in cell wall biosynthesis